MVVASIRSKNPGAMWGISGKRTSSDKFAPTTNKLALKWGSVQTEYLNDGLNQGNNIAYFPSFMQGICAQLDMWRTSDHYRNKKFKDAIHTWSGGNNVPSYIAYCKARVPGLTENTVMDDAFWNSAMGIAFLKAQAGHEAGVTHYPAADADWIEAQRRVFANDTPPKTAALAVQVPTARVDNVLRAYQAALIGFGYHEVGEADGRIGGKTMGAIKAFFTDRGIDSPAAYPSSALAPAIDAAKAEGWHRPIAPARAYKTEDDLSGSLASLPPAKNASLISRITGWFSGAAAVGGGALKLLPDTHDTVAPYKDMISDWFGAVPGFAWFGIVAAIAIVTAYQVNKSKSATVADYQRGKIN